MICSSLSIVDRKYLFTIVIVQTHLSEFSVDTDLARRKSGDFSVVRDWSNSMGWGPEQRGGGS